LVWLGLHGLLGVGIVAFLARKKPFGVRLGDSSKYGFVFGSIAPDLDLVASIPLIIAGAESSAVTLHRSVTHSFIVIAGIILIGYVSGYVGRKSIQSLLISLGLGMFTHVLFDLPTHPGVSILYPITTMRFGLFLGEFSMLAENVVLVAADFLFVAIFVYVIYFLAEKVNSSRHVNLKAFIISSLMVFLGLCAYALVCPPPKNLLVVHAVMGFPFLIAVFLLLHSYRRVIYKLNADQKV